MIQSFDCWPKRVICEPGALRKMSELIKSMDKKNVMIFTGPHLQASDMMKNLVKSLKEEGLTVHLFYDLESNPVTAAVDKAAEKMKEYKPDILLCIGGGSPIDAGKAANVVYTHGGTVKDYNVAEGGIAKISSNLLPMIAVPTTAGSGTEVTTVSVITDEETHSKIGIISPFMIPAVSVLDPEVTVSMSPKLTAYTGIDALTHCIEAYVSSVEFPPGDALALGGIRLIAKSLKKAIENGSDIDARQDMLIASLMGGIAFSHNGLGACHAMAHQLSDIPHGLANAILLPRIMKFNIPAATKKFADIAVALGGDIRDLTEQQAAELALQLVIKLSEDVGVPAYLDDAGVTKNKIPIMVERALIDNAITTNPRSATAEDITALYLESFK